MQSSTTGGRILEVFATTDDTRFRVAVTYDEAWQDEIFLRLKETEAGISKGDVISFVGRVNGLVTYQSVLGRELTIPDITIYALSSRIGGCLSYRASHDQVELWMSLRKLHSGQPCCACVSV